MCVFGNVDRAGEMVMPGAFSKTLQARGLPPVYYSHQWATPPIGAATKAVETETGLEIEARLFVDASERARECYEAMSAGVLREFSFAYDVLDASEGKVDDEPVIQLRELDLYEVGPTLVGMNPDTRLIDVRSGLWLPFEKVDVAELELAHAEIESLRARLAELEQVGVPEIEEKCGEDEGVVNPRARELRLARPR